MATYQATQKAADAPDIEAAMYDLVFVKAEDKLIKGGMYTKNKEQGDPKLELTFNVVSNDEDDPGLLFDKDGDAVELTKIVGVGFNTASKTTPSEVLFLKAILTKAEYQSFLDGEPTPADDVDAPEGLVGRVVQGEVFVKDNGWPGIGAIVAPKGGQKGKAYKG